MTKDHSVDFSGSGRADHRSSTPLNQAAPSAPQSVTSTTDSSDSREKKKEKKKRSSTPLNQAAPSAPQSVASTTDSSDSREKKKEKKKRSSTPVHQTAPSAPQSVASTTDSSDSREKKKEKKKRSSTPVHQTAPSAPQSVASTTNSSDRREKISVVDASETSGEVLIQPQSAKKSRAAKRAPLNVDTITSLDLSDYDSDEDEDYSVGVGSDIPLSEDDAADDDDDELKAEIEALEKEDNPRSRRALNQPAFCDLCNYLGLNLWDHCRLRHPGQYVDIKRRSDERIAYLSKHFIISEKELRGFFDNRRHNLHINKVLELLLVLGISVVPVGKENMRSRRFYESAIPNDPPEWAVDEPDPHQVEEHEEEEEEGDGVIVEEHEDQRDVDYVQDSDGTDGSEQAFPVKALWYQIHKKGRKGTLREKMIDELIYRMYDGDDPDFPYFKWWCQSMKDNRPPPRPEEDGKTYFNSANSNYHSGLQYGYWLATKGHTERLDNPRPLTLQLLMEGKLLIKPWFKKLRDCGMKAQGIRNRGRAVSDFYDCLQTELLIGTAHKADIDDIKNTIKRQIIATQKSTKRDVTVDKLRVLEQESLVRFKEVFRYQNNPEFLRIVEDIRSKFNDPEFVKRLSEIEVGQLITPRNRDVLEFFKNVVYVMCMIIGLENFQRPSTEINLKMHEFKSARQAAKKGKMVVYAYETKVAGKDGKQPGAFAVKAIWQFLFEGYHDSCRPMVSNDVSDGAIWFLDHNGRSMLNRISEKVRDFQTLLYGPKGKVFTISAARSAIQTLAHSQRVNLTDGQREMVSNYLSHSSRVVKDVYNKKIREKVKDMSEIVDAVLETAINVDDDDDDDDDDDEEGNDVARDAVDNGNEDGEGQGGEENEQNVDIGGDRIVNINGDGDDDMANMDGDSEMVTEQPEVTHDATPQPASPPVEQIGALKGRQLKKRVFFDETAYTALHPFEDWKSGIPPDGELHEFIDMDCSKDAFDRRVKSVRDYIRPKLAISFAKYVSERPDIDSMTVLKACEKYDQNNFWKNKKGEGPRQFIIREIYTFLDNRKKDAVVEEQPPLEEHLNEADQLEQIHAEVPEFDGEDFEKSLDRSGIVFDDDDDEDGEQPIIKKRKLASIIFSDDDDDESDKQAEPSLPESPKPKIKKTRVQRLLEDLRRDPFRHKMSLEDIVLHSINHDWTGLEIRPTDVCGEGVFLTMDVVEGTELCDYPGMLKDDAAALRYYQRHPEIEALIDEYRQSVRVVGNKKWTILAHKQGNQGYGHKINHSPHEKCINTRVEIKLTKNAKGEVLPIYLFKASKKMKANTQLLTTYGKSYKWPKGVIPVCPLGVECEDKKSRKKKEKK